MHFVLEYGEKTLANCLKEVDLAQYREILWQVTTPTTSLARSLGLRCLAHCLPWVQVLYALHVAGKTFSFSHYGTLTAPACPCLRVHVCGSVRR